MINNSVITLPMSNATISYMSPRELVEHIHQLITKDNMYQQFIGCNVLTFDDRDDTVTALTIHTNYGHGDIIGDIIGHINAEFGSTLVLWREHFYYRAGHLTIVIFDGDVATVVNDLANQLCEQVATVDLCDFTMTRQGSVSLPNGPTISAQCIATNVAIVSDLTSYDVTYSWQSRFINTGNLTVATKQCVSQYKQISTQREDGLWQFEFIGIEYVAGWRILVHVLSLLSGESNE